MLLSKYQNKLLFTIYLIVIAPIFINLNITQGIRFDANVFNFLGLPSLPMSMIVLFLLTSAYIIRLINVKMMILFFFMVIFLMINFLNGSGIKATIIFFGMLIPIVSYKVFIELLKNRINTYGSFFNAMVLIFIIKLVTDVILFGGIVTPKFISDQIIIYNYYDYFPFFYYLLIVLSLYNFSIGYKKIFSTIIAVVAWSVIIFTDSRLYQFSAFLIPIILFIFKIMRLKLNIYFNTIFVLVILITLVVALSEYLPLEASLSERFLHWINYFKTFTIWNFIFPFNNEYRMGYGSTGSFHNEILEQFSYFGVIIFYYYLFIIKDIFVSVESNFKPYSFLIMFVLVFGTLIQLNFSNPYIGVLFGLTFAIFHEEKTRINV